MSLDYFWLETFEDHLFNVPGVTASTGGVTSVVFGPSIHDSVDCDDGAIDGSGLLGDSYFGAPNIRFTFNADVLGSLPTHAGIVWTDGSPNTTVTFEAFGAGGASLGSITAVNGDTSNNGTTEEDRFYGVIESSGISAIVIRHTSGGLEVDHLQYGGGGAACAADLSGSSDPNDAAYGSPDGVVDSADFFFYLDQFVAMNLGAADLSGSSDPNDPAYGVPDGVIDAADFFFYLDLFVAGCG